MNLEINKITDAGNLENERIIFKVLVDDELGFYGVFKTKKTGETTVSSSIKATYWFPDRQVKQGDYVVLYSKVGVNTEQKNKDGTTSHFFYWRMSSTIWNDLDDCVVLFKIDEWKYKSVS